MNKLGKSTKPRILYIDNLRIALTCLVVLHHWAIANGAPGDWYYDENNLSEIGQLLMSMFVATNQAFFMGFFFFISAYFLPSSLKKKGKKLFLLERLKRLGIPLVFYIFIISPIINFMVAYYAHDYEGNFILFYLEAENIFSNGPLWFVALLLIFSVLYLVIQPAIDEGRLQKLKMTKVSWIFLFAGVVILTFFVRIYSPVGKWIPLLGIQPAHLIQYIVCFGLGIVVAQNGSLEKLSFRFSKRCLLVGQFLAFLVFPAIFIIAGAEDIELFMGGFTYQSMMYTLWEQLVAISLIPGLLGLFKRYFNQHSNLLKDLSANSYAIYILHGIALVLLSLLIDSWNWDSLFKFTALALPAILLSFILAKLVRSIRGVNSII